MERYCFSEEERSVLESMEVPFAVFQLVDNSIATLVVSRGFCELHGSGNLAAVYTAMNHDAFRYVHPDDAARLGNDVTGFMKEGERFESVYRLKKKNESGYLIIHAHGRHMITPTGVRLRKGPMMMRSTAGNSRRRNHLPAFFMRRASGASAITTI